MICRPECEADMLSPVLSLFPSEAFWHFEQVPLGRKKIDLVCVERDSPNSSISVELKISDWRTALWQASVNLQLSQRSFVAIWHSFAHRALKHGELFRQYGVGLISVGPNGAEHCFDSVDSVRRISREAKRDWYKQLVLLEC